ncbi:hypothetical protein VTO73DRAFT_9004 [Trametes versicolor]
MTDVIIIVSRGSLILVESLAIAVTWRQTRAAIQLRTGTPKRPSLEQVIWENGAVYFLTLVSMNAVNITFVVLSIAIPPVGISESYVLAFVDPVSSLLNSRFLLALHETNARLEGAADASLSSFSLDTGSGDDPSALASPDLPSFLGPIGGAIRFSYDDDDDMRSLEFAPPDVRHESGSELGGDILESSDSDAGNSMA